MSSSPKTEILYDAFGRVHNYLRISLTDHCNLRCAYCMPEEDYNFTPANRLMQTDEITEIAKAFVSMGVNKIRLTGGEPLVRKDAGNIIRKLSNLGAQLTLTTNATRIHEFIDLFEELNIRSLNVSLDTLQKDRFHLLTKRDLFNRVYSNIELLLQRQFHVKLNVVLMKGVNDDEIPDFIDMGRKARIHIRFIEFMPFEGNHWNAGCVVTFQDILSRTEAAYGATNIEPLERKPHETVKQFKIKSFEGTFAVISTMSAPFCSDCNRMRLTADGKMKNCLFSKGETDILGALRAGRDIHTLIRDNLHQKAAALGGQFSGNMHHVQAEDLVNRSMIGIGG